MADDGCTNDMPVTNDFHFCRECRKAFQGSALTTYYVVRDDGDYPHTQLCGECADEAHHDEDVIILIDYADAVEILASFVVITTVGNGDGTYKHSWTSKEQ